MNVLKRSSKASHLPSGDSGVLRRVVAAHVLDLVAARHSVFPAGTPTLSSVNFSLRSVAEEDPRSGVIELRFGAAFAHEHRLAAGGRDDVDAGVLAEERPAAQIAAGVAVHDRSAVRRERRLDIVSRLRDDVAAAAAVGLDHADAAQLRRRSTSCRRSTDRRWRRTGRTRRCRSGCGLLRACRHSRCH